MNHTCHAINCSKTVQPKMLMCLKHWKMVPAETQLKVWKLYRPGQEIDKQATAEYIEVAKLAIEQVHQKELAATRPTRQLF
ncbi:MAG TPA: hypothetical protein VK974_00850 [Methylophilaceae bacterium]|nr:hypothetical protein [Methylophilaceae bacterium]